MLKKLGAGEYSLKITFWMFGLLGMLFFTIATHITHSSALRMICPYGRVCAKSVVLYLISNFPILMTTSGRLSAFVPHLLTSALFICYFIILIFFANVFKSVLLKARFASFNKPLSRLNTF